MKENWEYIKNTDNKYMISSNGNVKSFVRNEIILKPGIYNYYYVKLMINGKRKNMRIHRLVATTFIPNPENKPQVNHIDGNKLNNKIYNLEWVTGAENLKHASNNGLMSSGYNHFLSKLSIKKARDIRGKYKLGYSMSELARNYGVCNKTIYNIIKAYYWKDKIAI